MRNLIRTTLLVYLAFLLITVNVNAKTSYNEVLLLVKQAETEIENLEGIDIQVMQYELVYDIFENPSFIYIIFADGGYTMVSALNGRIIMYVLESGSLPYKNVEDKVKKYFGGPYMFLSEFDIDHFKDEHLNSIVRKEVIINSITDDYLIKSSEFNRIDSNRPIESEQLSLSLTSWIGISETRFLRYNSGLWINNGQHGYPGNGICGTIATAILMAYLDDYVNDKYIPSSIRVRSSTSPGTLITTLAPLIDGATNYTGTYPSDLYVGSSNYFLNNSVSVIHNFGSTTFSTAKTVINSGRPIAIGLLSALGSSYGNHWVTAYQYEDGSYLNDYYKVIDNWGNYKATISVGWTFGFYKISG